jgi:hypothetical protein
MAVSSQHFRESRVDRLLYPRARAVPRVRPRRAAKLRDIALSLLAIGSALLVLSLLGLITFVAFSWGVMGG